MFVRVSNKIATEMYTKFGYTVYRRVLDYYTGENDEDAFGKNCFVFNKVALLEVLIMFEYRYEESNA